MGGGSRKKQECFGKVGTVMVLYEQKEEEKHNFKKVAALLRRRRRRRRKNAQEQEREKGKHLLCTLEQDKEKGALAALKNKVSA